MAEYQSVLTFVAFLAAFAVLTALLGMRERKKTRKKLYESLRSGFGKASCKKLSPERYAQIPSYDLHHPGIFRIDDITWNDLDMDRLYRAMDTTRSASGEEYLYHLLRSPAMSAQGLPFRQDQYDWVSDSANEMQRIRLQEILTRLGHAGRYSLYDYIDFTDALGTRSSLPHYLAAAAPFLAFLVMFWNTGIGMVALLVVFAVNLRTYFKEKAEIAPYFQVFNYILRLLDCAQDLQKENCPAFQEETERIPAVIQSFSAFRRGSSFLLGSVGGDSDPLGIILEYVRILFHLDLIKFNSMLGQMRGRQREIDTLLTITGRIDACISIASWRQTLPWWTLPAFVDPGLPGQAGSPAPAVPRAVSPAPAVPRAVSPAPAVPQAGSPAPAAWQADQGDPTGTAGCGTNVRQSAVFEAEDLYHPLLQDPVSNNICAPRPVLLTGSNASGKSTFLKAAALCALLAQAVGICPARQYRGSWYRIYTSMALRDSLQDGESYFIVEIKSLRRILQAAQETSEMPGPVLCCIDEVLRGTNTVERIAASAEILGCFARTDTLCFAATHDLELTGLLGDVYDNYHFSEEITDGDVRFSYLLKKGPSTSCNAIALLSSLGYDQALVGRARSRADAFLQEGKWK